MTAANHLSQNMNATRVLVTGATGFIGKPLLKLLVKRGFQVHAAVRTQPKDSMAQVHYHVCGTINDQTNWSNFLSGIDVIVHLVGLVHVRGNLDTRDRFFRTNVTATANLVQQAIQHSVKRIVYMSTIKVNGESTHERGPFRAEDLPTPEDIYGQSKLDAESQLFAMAQQSDIEAVVIRPPLVYGPSPKGNFAILSKAVRWGLPLPFGAIENQRSLISVFNLCDCVVTCLTHPKAAGEVFLVCDGNDVSTPQLIRLMANALGTKPRLWSVSPALLNKLARLLKCSQALQRLGGDLQVDMNKAQRLLDWTPPYTIEEGLALSIGK